MMTQMRVQMTVNGYDDEDDCHNDEDDDDNAEDDDGDHYVFLYAYHLQIARDEACPEVRR